MLFLFTSLKQYFLRFQAFFYNTKKYIHRLEWGLKYRMKFHVRFVDYRMLIYKCDKKSHVLLVFLMVDVLLHGFLFSFFHRGTEKNTYFHSFFTKRSWSAILFYVIPVWVGLSPSDTLRRLLQSFIACPWIIVEQRPIHTKPKVTKSRRSVECS